MNRLSRRMCGKQLVDAIRNVCRLAALSHGLIRNKRDVDHRARVTRHSSRDVGCSVVGLDDHDLIFSSFQMTSARSLMPG